MPKMVIIFVNSQVTSVHLVAGIQTVVSKVVFEYYDTVLILYKNFKPLSLRESLPSSPQKGYAQNSSRQA